MKNYNLQAFKNDNIYTMKKDNILYTRNDNIQGLDVIILEFKGCYPFSWC